MKVDFVSAVSIFTLAFFSLLFTWQKFFQTFPLNLHLPVGLKYVFCGRYLDGSYLHPFCHPMSLDFSVWSIYI